MVRQELDGRFYRRALAFFVDSGHIDTPEAEFSNHDPEQFVYADALTNRSLSPSQKSLFSYFDNISKLFTVNNCVFYSAELFSDCVRRSQLAHDVHALIHSLAGEKNTVCVFACSDEVIFSFKSSKIDYVLSDWYPMDDFEGELVSKLDISNVSTASSNSYISDLAFSLARDYYRMSPATSIYPYMPIDGIRRVRTGKWSKEDLNQILIENADQYIRKYDRDYADCREIGRFSRIVTDKQLDNMLKVSDDRITGLDVDDVFEEESEEKFIEQQMRAIRQELVRPNKKEPPDSSVIDLLERVYTDLPVKKEKKKPKKKESKYMKRAGTSRKKQKTGKMIKLTGEKVKEKEAPIGIKPVGVDDTAAIIKKLLSVTNKPLDVYMIQNLTGINNLDVLELTLRELNRAGEVIRSLPRGLRRPVYELKRVEKKRNQRKITENINAPAKNEPEPVLSDDAVEREIIRILNLTGYPISLESIKRKSLTLVDADNGTLWYALNKLCANRIVSSSFSDGYFLYSLYTGEQKRTDAEPPVKTQNVKKTAEQPVNKKEFSGNELSIGMKQMPYGYEMKDKRIVIHPVEAMIVRLIFKLYNDGNGMTTSKIAESLNQQGYRKRTGSEFTSTTVISIWRKKELYQGKPLKYSGEYPRIL